MDNLQASVTPCVLSAAGSDSGSGAGIQADLKTISALGGYGCAAVTAITAQNRFGVSAWESVSAEMVEKQIDAVGADFEIEAIKIGMLGSSDVVSATARAVSRLSCRRVVADPVIASTSGDSLIDDHALDAMIAELFPSASLLTSESSRGGASFGISERRR